MNTDVLARRARVKTLAAAFCEMRRAFNDPINPQELAVVLRFEFDDNYRELGITHEGRAWTSYLYMAKVLIKRWRQLQAALQVAA